LKYHQHRVSFSFIIFFTNNFKRFLKMMTKHPGRNLVWSVQKIRIVEVGVCGGVKKNLLGRKILRVMKLEAENSKLECGGGSGPGRPRVNSQQAKHGADGVSKIGLLIQ
jgi:hypothetical protein